MSTADGDSAIKSCAAVVFGNAITSRMDFSPASSITTRSSAQRDAAMRRRAIGERVQKEPEALARCLVAQAQRLEHARLHILAMNSDAAGAELDAVQHQIVALRAALPRRGFELVEVFFEDSGERMLRAHPALVVLAPFKKREAGDPGKFPFAAVNQVELVAQIQANLARDVQRSVVVRDLFLGGNGDDQVARFRAELLRRDFSARRRRDFFRAAR